MSQVVNQFNFTVIDYTTTQFGYLFTVGTTGSRPEDYRFIYMPYSRYPSVLMLDFYMARSISHGVNHHLVEAIQKDLEGEEQFIVLGEPPDNKEEILHHSLEGSSLVGKQGVALDFSLEMERSTLIEALEMDTHAGGDRPNILKDALLHTEMSEGWRVDNDKELKIVRNLGLTRNFVNHLDKLEPSKITFRVSEFGMIADYAVSAEQDIQAELSIEQIVYAVRRDHPMMDVAKVYNAVQKIIGRETANESLLEAVQDHFRNTQLEETVQSRKISKQDIQLLYQDLLGVRDDRKDTYNDSIEAGRRIDYDRQMFLPSAPITAYTRRFQDINYMHIHSTLALAQRGFDVGQMELLHTLGIGMRDKRNQATTTGEISQAIREMNENLFLSQLDQAKRDIKEGMATHEHVLAKLKDRQYPTFLHSERRGKREVAMKSYIHEQMWESSRDPNRNGSVFHSSDTLWQTSQAYRIINDNPTITESGIITSSREMSAISEVEREFTWAVRNHTADMFPMTDMTTAQRLFMEQMDMNHEPVETRRIYVVHSVIEHQDEQAYRDSTEYGYVFRSLHESQRLYKRAGDITKDSNLGRRLVSEALELLRQDSLGERQSDFDSYVQEKFYVGQTETRDLYLPRSMEQADRKKTFESHMFEVTRADRDKAYDLWLPEPEGLTGNRDPLRVALNQKLHSFYLNKQQKNAFLSYQPFKSSRSSKNMNLETILHSRRDQEHAAMVRDELLDKLIGGGWLGNKTYPGYLDEELIVGEIMQDLPAVVLEMLIEAVQNPDHSLYVNEEYVADIRHRIDSLIESGFLVADKHNNQSELLSFNFEAMKNVHHSHMDMLNSEASIESTSSVMQDNSMDAEMGKAQSMMETARFEGIKVKENLYGEITEVTYGADYDTRPATIEAEDPMGYLIPGGGLFPDDPAYETGQVERQTLPLTESMEGQRFDGEGTELSEQLTGLINSREGEAHLDLSMADITRERFGVVHESLGSASVNLRQVILQEEVLTGDSKFREGTSDDTMLAGTSQSRETMNYDELPLGTAHVRQVYLNDSYSSGKVDSDHAMIEFDQTVAEKIWSPSFVDYDYSSGRSLSREGISDVEYSLSFTKLRERVLDHVLDMGERHVQQSDLDLSLSHLEGMKQGRSSFSDDELIAGKMHAKYANADDMLVGESALYDGSMIGQYVADNLKQMFDLPEELFFNELNKSALMHTMETEVIKLRQGQMHEDQLVAGHLFKHFILTGQDAIAASKNNRDTYLQETVESSKEKAVQLEEQFVADKPQYGELDFILPLGGTNLKYGDIPVESIGGTGLHYGDIPTQIVGGTNLKYGIEHGLSLADKPQYGELQDVWLADKPQYGHWEENLIGLKQVKETVLFGTLDMIKESYEAYFHETMHNGFKVKHGSAHEELLYSYKDVRYASTDTELVGLQNKQADVMHLESGDNQNRDAHINNNLVMSSKKSFFADDHHLYEGAAEPRDTTLDLNHITAVKMDRYVYSHEQSHAERWFREGQGFDKLFGSAIERLSYSEDDQASYGSSDAYQSYIVKDGETFGSKLADPAGTHEMTFEAVTEERLSKMDQEMHEGIANARLSEMEEPESLMASFEERCSQAIMGFIFADRPERRSEYLQELYAFLPERTAHLMEYYHHAKMEPSEGFEVTDHLFAHQEAASTYIPVMDTMAQGLIFDYSDDLLDQGMNPEDWEGGLGVPEDYDPNDPFNVYYPYSKDMDALELSQADEWKSFGQGEWDRDPLLGKFYAKEAAKDISGWFRNNFLADTYKFSVDFKVESGADDNGAGIIFKYYDELNYWMFMVHGGNRDNSLDMRTPMQLYRVVAGQVQPMGSPMQPFKWEKDKWYKLSVSVMDNRLQIYTDSKLQYDLTGAD